MGCLFHCIAYDYSRTEWDGLCDHLGNFPWEDIFKLSASAAASEFFEWIQVGIDVYIPHHKYPVCCALYLRNQTSSDHNFWYMYVKW